MTNARKPACRAAMGEGRLADVGRAREHLSVLVARVRSQHVRARSVQQGLREGVGAPSILRRAREAAGQCKLCSVVRGC